MKVDPQTVRDQLVDDAVGSAHAEGRTVNARAAEDYVVGVLQRLERKQAEAPAKAGKPKPERDEANQTAKEFRKRTGRELPEGLGVERGRKSSRRVVKASELERVGRARLAERLRWIKQRPDLFEQVKGISVALNSSDKPTRERAAEKLRAFIAKTDRLAGHDWRKPQPKKLVYSG